MPNPRRLRALGWALLGAASGIAGPARGALAPPRAGPAPVTFTVTVHNHLRHTLHGFRIKRETDERPEGWQLIGDVPPGSTSFRAAVAQPILFGSFQFLLDEPGAHGDYLMGAFAAPHEAQVRIDIPPGAWPRRRASAASPASATPPATPQAPQLARSQPSLRTALREQRLQRVAADAADASGAMACRQFALGGAGFLRCASSRLNFQAPTQGAVAALGFGRFIARRSVAELLDVPLVRARGLSMLAMNQIDFHVGAVSPSGTPIEHEPLGSYVGLALGTIGGFETMGRFVEAVPSPTGSFRASCSRISYDEITGLLVASCDGPNGAQWSQIDVLGSCNGGDIANHDGTLGCERPPGSYLQTCRDVRYLGGQLRALCRTSTGTLEQRSTLDYPGACPDGAGVANADGHLQCETPVEPPPAL